jgi:predicted phage-related endonuclease
MRASDQQTLFGSSEEDMKKAMWKKSSNDRRYFIGGSDARIIMGDDEGALIRLAGKTR